jgi:hypothetical protein
MHSSSVLRFVGRELLWGWKSDGGAINSGARPMRGRAAITKSGTTVCVADTVL